MKIELDNRINHRIAILSGLMKRQIYRIISDKGLDITPEQWSILSYLWEENGLSIGEIVSKSRKDFANVTRIVGKLQNQGYVLKKKSEKDGRSYLVYYTEKAEEIKSRVEECLKLSLNISLKDISKEEQKLFLQIIEKLEKNSLDFLVK